MRRFTLIAASLAGLAAVAALSLAPAAADAASKKKSKKTTAVVKPKSSGLGGYSYSVQDSIVEFRDRSVIRDPNIGTQDGPFDSGYFFDSNITPWGNDSPYQN